MAVGLDIDPALVTRYERRGMPMESVEAARAWKAANIGARVAPASPTKRAAAKQVQTVVPEPADPQKSPPVWKTRAMNTGTEDLALGAFEVAAVNRLWLIARAALDADRFDLVEDELRAALRAVPVEVRNEVELDFAVMNVLVAHVYSAVLESNEPAHGPPLPMPVTMSDEQIAVMGDFWYSVAAEEPTAWDKF